MSDLVKRLRDVIEPAWQGTRAGVQPSPLCQEAAARIEALEAELAALKAPLPDEGDIHGTIDDLCALWALDAPVGFSTSLIFALRPHLAAIRRQALEEAMSVAAPHIGGRVSRISVHKAIRALIDQPANPA